MIWALKIHAVLPRHPRFARLVHVLAVSCLGIVACGVTEQRRPLPSDVFIAFDNTFEVSVPPRTRLALVWTAEQSMISTYDTAVNVEAGPISVPLEMPAPEIVASAFPIEPLELQLGVAVPAYRPRFVLYEDVDANARLNPTVLDMQGPDRIIAVDEAGDGAVIALLDIENALDSISLEATAGFYAATRGRFTPFVRGTVRSGALGLGISAPPLTLRMSDGPRPQTDLACARRNLPGRSPRLYATSRVSATVDSALDANAVCGGIFASCVSADFQTVSAPPMRDIETDSRIEIVQCRQGGQREVLILHQAVLDCEPCVCTTRAHADIWFADSAALPAWWPCGDAVAYCDSDLPIYAIDPECVVPEEEEE